MLEPDLTVRAQRAAAELERAWQRWRAMHNPGAESLPPVSSFLGYSMEDPWGQPRVVFGIAASDAEQLAALLERRDAEGSVYAAMTSRSAARPEQNTNGAAAAAERGIAPIHVPSQTKPAAAQRAAVAPPTRPAPVPGHPAGWDRAGRRSAGARKRYPGAPGRSWPGRFRPGGRA